MIWTFWFVYNIFRVGSLGSREMCRVSKGIAEIAVKEYKVLEK